MHSYLLAGTPLLILAGCHGAQRPPATPSTYAPKQASPYMAVGEAPQTPGISRSRDRPEQPTRARQGTSSSPRLNRPIIGGSEPVYVQVRREPVQTTPANPKTQYSSANTLSDAARYCRDEHNTPCRYTLAVMAADTALAAKPVQNPVVDLTPEDRQRLKDYVDKLRGHERESEDPAKEVIVDAIKDILKDKALEALKISAPVWSRITWALQIVLGVQDPGDVTDDTFNAFEIMTQEQLESEIAELKSTAAKLREISKVTPSPDGAAALERAAKAVDARLRAAEDTHYRRFSGAAGVPPGPSRPSNPSDTGPKTGDIPKTRPPSGSNNDSDSDSNTPPASDTNTPNSGGSDTPQPAEPERPKPPEVQPNVPVTIGDRGPAGGGDHGGGGNNGGGAEGRGGIGGGPGDQGGGRAGDGTIIAAALPKVGNCFRLLRSQGATVCFVDKAGKPVGAVPIP